LIHLQLRKQEKEETQRAAKAALAAAQECHAAYFTHKNWFLGPKFGELQGGPMGQHW
jgi:hypothetical protein